MGLYKGNLDSPDETRPFRAHGHAAIVTLEKFTIGRTVFEPGWRWSNDIKPIAGTESCQVRHAGACIAGHMTVRAHDGTEVTYGPGDVFLIDPGHDAWVVGDETCVMLDTGVAPFAKPAVIIG